MQAGMRKGVIHSGEGMKVLIGWLVVSLIVAVGVFLSLREGLTTLPDWLELAGKGMAEARKEPFPFIIGGISALVFVGIVIKLLVDTTSLLRFGVTALQLDPNPGSVGGHLGGTLQLGYSLQPEDKVTVTVVCWRHYIRKRRNKSETARERTWSDEVQPEMSQQFNQLQLRFTVDLPEDLPPSGEQGDDTYRWEVILRIDRKGRDIVRAFKVPVTADDSPRYAARPMHVNQPAAMNDSVPGMAIENTRGMLAIRGLPGRNFTLNLTFLLFGMVFGGAGVFLGYGVALENWQRVLDASHDGMGRVFGAVFAIMSSFMALIFFAVGLLMLVVAVSGARNRRELRLDNDRLSTRNRGASEDIPLHDTERLEVSETGSIGTSTIHDVHAVTLDGERIAVLEGIPGTIAMKRITGLLEQHTGKPVEIVSRSERRARRRLMKQGRKQDK